jgi:carboxypeptidase Taq
MGKQYDALVARLREIHNVEMAATVLSWDQSTQMPPGGAEARAGQLATLSKIAHNMFTSDETGQLLEDAASEVSDDEYNSDASSMVRVIQEDYDEGTKIPTEWVTEFTQLTSMADGIWAKARQDKDFSQFQPSLERIVEMVRQKTELLGYEDHPYSALLNQYERGVTTTQVKQIFDDHKAGLIELIAAINANSDNVDDSILHRPYDTDKQRTFGLKMIEAFGFDFSRGYQAVSVHPFCTHFSSNDVRITTRFDPDFLNTSIFGMMHEAGHGMYEQGMGQNLEGTPLASGTSLGIHESQSRMWENLVGRSKGFWSWALPQLKEVYPHLESVDLNTFYKAINKSAPSFIRVEADEVNYNLHIILRFEIEMDLITGNLAVKDAPEVWNTKFNEFFGITPTDDAQGVLQDVHWSYGIQGYFPTYALGNLLSVQFYNKAVQAHPNIPSDIANGKFDTLLTWLNTNIHQHGRKLTSDELTKQVADESIQSRDYLDYLTTKFSEIYEL